MVDSLIVLYDVMIDDFILTKINYFHTIIFNLIFLLGYFNLKWINRRLCMLFTIPSISLSDSSAGDVCLFNSFKS